jgi:transmembrane sensor
MTNPQDDQHLEALQRELRLRAWDRRQLESAWGNIVHRRQLEHRRNQRMKVAGGALVSVAFVFALVLGIRAVFTPTQPAPQAAATAPAVHGLVRSLSPRRLSLGLETEARLDKGTQIDVREQTPARVVVALHSGSAGFRVRHDPTRLFRVEAGEVAIEDLGTAFEVKHQGKDVFVSVSHGAVSVSFPENGKRGSSTLRAGESGSYPAAGNQAVPLVTAPVPSSPSVASTHGETSIATAPKREPSAEADLKPTVNWRELARAGKYRQAYDLLTPAGFRDVRDDPADLLLASDVARLSRHSGEAVTLLRKLLTRHTHDSRAPSAAFTLGWLLMNDLSRPAEAAQAFARAEELAPRGNLAEDAAARAVEAWHRAGDAARANVEFARYKRAYPAGRHLATLQRLVGTR